ncbi:MAG: hypothetical protein KJZ65_10170 [Phycisphaerales bacterium]|nr:hypothetical protein [Phycisphaerales bacterium]
MKRALAMILLASLLSGCEPAAPPTQAPEPAATARATSELGTLTLSLSRTELSTVERLEVAVGLEHASGVTVSELGFQPEQAGWTLVASESSRVLIRADGRAQQMWLFRLEPFLDGTYEVPPARIELRKGTVTAELSTPSQAVTVTSVLAEAGHELAAARPPVQVAANRNKSALPLLVGGVIAGAMLAGGGLWWRLRSRRKAAAKTQTAVDQPIGARGQIESVRRRLRELLASRIGAMPASATGAEMLASARARLSGEQAARVEQLLAHLDRLWYGPDEPSFADAEAVAGELASLEFQAEEGHA